MRRSVRPADAWSIRGATNCRKPRNQKCEVSARLVRSSSRSMRQLGPLYGFKTRILYLECGEPYSGPDRHCQPAKGFPSNHRDVKGERALGWLRCFAGRFDAGFLAAGFLPLTGFAFAVGATTAVAAVLLRPPGTSSPPPYRRR